MESVIMTSPGGSARLKSRLRNAASNFFSRSSKNRTSAPKNNHHAIGHKSTKTGFNGNFFKKKSSPKHNANANATDGTSNCIPEKTEQKEVMIFRGNFTREVYNVICNRLGPTANIPGESVQMLFNDMNLYPSKSQVAEMLQCARQCSRRNGSPFLTFGEFCLFARELKRPEIYKKSKQQHKQNDICSKNCEVFLGGSCNPTTWRTDIAIPELQKFGISYYNPQKPFWSPELVSEEHDAKQSASVLLYVVESQTRNVVGMMEVAYLMASDRCVVLVIYPYQFGQSIMGEHLSNREYVDLVEGQTTLIALVKSQGVRVHENLSSALQHTANLLRNSSCNGMSAEAMVTFKLRKLRELFDSYDNNNKEELTLSDAMDAFQRLTNRSLKASDLYNYLNIRNSTDPTKFRISFEHFCAIVAEFSSLGSCSTNGLFYDWTHNILNRQCSSPSNNNGSVVKGVPTWDSNYLVDVCLGGSFRTQHSWREQVAIPLLKKHGLTYYNPAIRETNRDNSTSSFRDDGGERENAFANSSKYESSVSESDILEWVRVMNRSKVLLFVITNDTKSLSSMILAAHYVGLGRDVVLCIQQLPQQECRLGNETITDQAVKDYNRGRVYLRDFAKRKQIPVFENITEAVQCTVEKCQTSLLFIRNIVRLVGNGAESYSLVAQLLKKPEHCRTVPN